MLTSSQGDGLKLRITSFALLIVPVLNSMLRKHGVTIAPNSVENFIDSFFVVSFGFIHLWGWLRSFKKPATSK